MKERKREKKSDMAFLGLLSCSLIFIVAADPFHSQLSIPLEQDILQFYNIHLELYVGDDIFYAEYNVRIYIPHARQDLYFYNENLSIIQIMLTNNTKKVPKEYRKIAAYTPKKLIYDTEKHVTTISFPHALSPGFYVLSVKFSGFFSENGGIRKLINDKLWLGASHYLPFGTRRLFPLLKDTFHGRFNISIKHHKNYTALSNMAVQEVNVDENNMRWTRFKSTPIMPIYFIAASIVNLAFTSATDQKATLWHRKDITPHLQFAYSILTNIMRFLEVELPYIRKTPETDYIVIPELIDTEKIMLGLVVCREEDLILVPEIDGPMRVLKIVQLVAYKVVHEWHYNAIDPFTWAPWLSKGFVIFLGTYAINETYPGYRMQDLFLIQSQHEFLHWSTQDTWPLTIKSEFNNSFEVPRYIAVSIMFRTMRSILTENVFWNGIGIYFKILKYVESFSSVNFWNIMQQVVNDSSIETKFNIMDRIAKWTQVKYYPVVNVRRNYNSSNVTISVKNLTNIWIHVNITTKTHSDLKILLPGFWLSPLVWNYMLNIDFINEDDWILVNSQQSAGCYRVNYDEENWNRLSIFLNSDSFKKIHVLDRATIIDDAFHFLMTGQLNFTVFSNIVQYLKEDLDFAAWYPLFKNMEYISGCFAFSETAPIKAVLAETLNASLWRVKYPAFRVNRFVQGGNFIRCMREEISRWICVLKHRTCLIIVNSELKTHLLNRYLLLSNVIWPGWKEWMFCNGLVTGTENTWLQLFDLYLKKSEEVDHNVLKFLACSKNSTIIFEYINLMTLGATLGKVITDFDHINSLCFIIARHARNIEVLNHILTNLGYIKPKQIDVIPILSIIINHVYYKEHVDKIKEYLKNNIHYLLKYPPLSTINYNHSDSIDELMQYWSFKRNYAKMMMGHVNRKLELRLHQVQTQLYEFRYLTEINMNKEELDD